MLNVESAATMAMVLLYVVLVLPGLDQEELMHQEDALEHAVEEGRRRKPQSASATHATARTSRLS